MRYLITIAFLFAFSAQCFAQAIIVAGYYANTAAFAKKCENKAKPMMRCNGKCQLMKKMQEDEKKGEQLPERKLEMKTEVSSSNSFSSTGPCFRSFTVKKEYAAMVTAKASDRSLAFFRPPCNLSPV